MFEQKGKVGRLFVVYCSFLSISKPTIATAIITAMPVLIIYISYGVGLVMPSVLELLLLLER